MMKIIRENLLWMKHCFLPVQPPRGLWEPIKSWLCLRLQRSRPWDQDVTSKRLFENGSWGIRGWEYGVRWDAKAAIKGGSLGQLPLGTLKPNPAGASWEAEQSRPQTLPLVERRSVGVFVRHWISSLYYWAHQDVVFLIIVLFSFIILFGFYNLYFFAEMLCFHLF